MTTETCFSKKEQANESVIDNIYGIIDSKIQYLNYQTKGIVCPLIQTQYIEDSVSGEAKSDSLSLLEYSEKMFLHFEKQSKRKKLLLCLRALLNSNNALLALELLSENTLFEFDEKELAFILNSNKNNKAA